MNSLLSTRRKNTLVALGAAMALVAAFLAWQSTSSVDEPGVPTAVAIDATTPAPKAVPKAAPKLVDLADLPAAEAQAAPEASPVPPTKPAVARSKKEPLKVEGGERARASKARDEGAGTRVPQSVRCSVAPVIDTHLVPELNYGLPVSISAAPLGGDAGLAASDSGLINDALMLTYPVSLVNGGFPLQRIVVDHPDAMPAIAIVDDWGPMGDGLIAYPKVKLQPIGCRLQLGGLRTMKNARHGDVHPFTGTATLISLAADGDVVVIDRAGIESSRRHEKPLRFDRSPGEIFILGLPKSAAEAAHVLELTKDAATFPTDGSYFQLPATLLGRTPTPIRLEVLDPFGETVKDAKITATVNSRFVARFDAAASPVRFGDFVFVKASGPGLGLARRQVEAETGKNGRAVLRGIDPKVTEFQVTSPFGDRAAVGFRVQSTDEVQIVHAPMGAVEVHCPAVWRKDAEGLATWARAKIKLSGPSKRLPFTGADAKASKPRRYLVPAGGQITISCQAKGQAMKTRQIQGPGQRQITSYFPTPAK